MKKTIFATIWRGSTGALIGWLTAWFWRGAFSYSARTDLLPSAAAYGVAGGIFGGYLLLRNPAAFSRKVEFITSGLWAAFLGTLASGFIAATFAGDPLAFFVVPMLFVVAVIFPMGIITIPLLIFSLHILARFLKNDMPHDN